MRYHSAGGIIVTNDEQRGWLFLAVRQERKTGEVQWVAPKGRIETGETPEQAAKREILEETGLRVTNSLGFVGSQSFSFKDSNEESNEKVVDWFLFEVSGDTKLQMNKDEGFLEYRWLPFPEARALFTHHAFLEFLDQCASRLGRYEQDHS